MKALIIGGTGTLGRQIAKKAIDSGIQVRCMVRRPRKASYLQEWGCELTQGDLLNPKDLEYALSGIDAVIDAATSRPDDPRSVYETDWQGKLNLFRACESVGVKRVVFLSLLAAEQFRNVPLMDIKYCTEKLLEESSLDFTILQGAAFMQGVIGQFAIPILDNQPVWISGNASEIAYMNTQDMAAFAVAALERPQTIRRSYPLVGPKSWKSEEVVKLCEGFSDKKAKILRVSPFLIAIAKTLVSFFQASLNVAERLSFADVSGSGMKLDAPMEDTYKDFDLDPALTTNLESYIKEYYGVILKRLREMEADLSKEQRKKLPF
ncbi:MULTISPECIES: NAD(P)H-binding protein [unclassified Prochlorococcus]|uniref:NAD(P)H-binding protein n=1 Tax=unclassified Prochlorococcus TaxID=2627481 RepID=UPI0005339ECD|nr:MULTISPECIES: NAD(P)H-binding protein [unclassified Prochlorococcus]KGG17846.1 putative chaperon-like protein Ycf39 for quinone binding in Photosystem II [Prochlorococcus sp. MIT 0603]